jgi:hypothetical protein
MSRLGFLGWRWPRESLADYFRGQPTKISALCAVVRRPRAQRAEIEFPAGREEKAPFQRSIGLAAAVACRTDDLPAVAISIAFAFGEQIGHDWGR